MNRGCILTSGFGPRWGTQHRGQDIGWPGGSGGQPVFAARGGTIAFLRYDEPASGPGSGFGWYFGIDHPTADGGGFTVYGHCELAIEQTPVGSRVEAGQYVGWVNPSRNSNGGVDPHLHFEVFPSVYVPGYQIDPLPWLADAVYPGDEPTQEVPTVTPRGLDFAAARPGAAAIKAAGYQFVVRYLSDGGRTLPGKQLLPDEADDYRAHGVSIVSNWETWADMMRGGFAAGVEDAHRAFAQVLACGGRADRPIYFSADWDASAAEQAVIDDYLRGAASVIGAENVGVYGSRWVVGRCLDNGTARWAWQCEAWSGGQVDPRINILQNQLDNGQSVYAYVNGVQCDINEAFTEDYGQWEVDNMPSAQEVAAAVWQHRISKPNATGNVDGVDNETAGNLLSWTDKHAGDSLDVSAGAGARDVWEPVGPEKFDFLDGLPIAQALGVIGEALKVPGFRDPRKS